MESIGDIVNGFKRNMSPEQLARFEAALNMTEQERMEKKCRLYNESVGHLNEVDGYECKTCKNKGMVAEAQEFPGANGGTYWLDVYQRCKCMTARASIHRMEKSGLRDVIKAYRFDSYTVEKQWQQNVKEAAMRFARDDSNMFFIGGSNGAGKTHICTAIAAQYLRNGHEVRYMLWKDEVVRIKAAVNDTEEYERLMNQYKNAPVLYIDDFFKIINDRGGEMSRPTEGDINVAYELINHRYNKRDLVTIISSERYITEIVDIDEAIGSRIYERTKDNGYCLNIKRDKNNNYRLRGMSIMG